MFPVERFLFLTPPDLFAILDCGGLDQPNSRRVLYQKRTGLSSTKKIVVVRFSLVLFFGRDSLFSRSALHLNASGENERKKSLHGKAKRARLFQG